MRAGSSAGLGELVLEVEAEEVSLDFALPRLWSLLVEVGGGIEFVFEGTVPLVDGSSGGEVILGDAVSGEEDPCFFFDGIEM